MFSLLDDYDIWGSMKFWRNHEDFVLSTLSAMLLDRKIFQVQFDNEKPSKEIRSKIKLNVANEFDVSLEEAQYFVGNGKISNAAYILKGESINILTKKGAIQDIVQATDLPNIKAMSKVVTKYFLCWPKGIAL